MSRTVAILAVVIGVALLADDAHASEEACVDPPVELAGPDCADSTEEISVWTAGVRGLCDAPFGLGLRRTTVHLLRAAGIVSPDGAPSPLPADSRVDRFTEGHDVGHVPPPRFEARDPHGPSLAAATPCEAHEPPHILPAGRAVPAPPSPGFSRRIERPPRPRS